MIESILLGFIVGLVLGFLYFGGLWVTVKRFTAGARHSRQLVLVSFLVRTLIVLLGFYWLLTLTTHWQVTALALAGFIVSRLIITKIVVGNVEMENATEDYPPDPEEII